MTIMNIGKVPARVLTGFATYSYEGTLLDRKNYPYKNSNHVLHVVDSKKNSNSIIVDSCPQWDVNCSLAFNAQNDLSDIPNLTLAEGVIKQVNMLPNGNAEIILDKPLDIPLDKGSKIRVHGIGGDYLYTNDVTLQPGEETVLSSLMHKEGENSRGYPSSAFPKDAYYVAPIVLSWCLPGAVSDNSIEIKQFQISF